MIYIVIELFKYCIEIVSFEEKKNIINFEVEVILFGMVYFKLMDLSIVKWLSYLIFVFL